MTLARAVPRPLVGGGAPCLVPVPGSQSSTDTAPSCHAAYSPVSDLAAGVFSLAGVTAWRDTGHRRASELKASQA